MFKIKVVRLQREAEATDASLLQPFLSKDAKLTMEPSLARQKFLESLRQGAVLRWVVTELDSLELKVQPEFNEMMGLNITAVVHISCAVNSCDGFDDIETSLNKAVIITPKNRFQINEQHPFYGITVGSKVLGRVLQVRHNASNSDDDTSHSSESWIIYLAISSSSSAFASKEDASKHAWRPMVQWRGKDGIKNNVPYSSVVISSDDTGCVVALSPYITGKLNFIDISSDIELVTKFKNHCFCGMKIVLAVLSSSHGGDENVHMRQISVSRVVIENLVSGSVLLDLSKDRAVSVTSTQFKKGMVVNGIVDLFSKRISCFPAIAVHLPGGVMGEVCVTELAERSDWVDMSSLFNSADKQNDSKKNALGVSNGQIISCRILSVPTTERGLVNLSLRNSRLVKMNTFYFIDIFIYLLTLLFLRSKIQKRNPLSQTMCLLKV